MSGDIDGPTVRINADASKVDAALSGLKDKFSSFGNDLTGIAKGFNLDNVASQIDKVSDKFKNIGSTLAISAAPFEIYGALAVKAFSDFEQGIAKINTLLPDATKAEMEAVGEQLKAFSSDFGADINDAIQAYYDALSAGVAQGDVLPFMETAQKAGVAGMSDVSVAVDGLTSILNSYQKKTSEAENVSDVMFKTVELGKIEFEQLAANIGKVAPTAAQFKIGFEDVGAAIASITSQGLKPEQTMTVLTSLISQLGKSGTDLSDKFKEITGQSFPDFIASGGTLADAIGKIRDYSQDTGTSLMDMTGNLEAAKGLAMLGGSAFEQYAGFLDKISDSAGATDTAYSKMSETMAFAMDQLKAQMQTTMIEVGDALAPVVKDFTKWLSENSDEISDFAVSIAQNAVPAIEKLFDILKGLMDSFNNLPGDTKSILAQLLGVGAVGAAAGGPALFGAGIALGPVSSILKMLGSFNGSNLSNASKDVDALSDAVKRLAGSTGNYKIAEEIGLIGPAAATAAGSGGVGALTTALSTIAVPAFGLLFATQADHVMDAVGRLTTDYLRDVRMEVEVQSILGKPDETGFRSWLVEFTKQPIEVQIKAVPLLGSAYELGEQFSQDLFLQANNDFSQNTVLKNKFNQFQAEAKTAVEAAGKSVKTFSHRDVAEMNNYLAKSTGKIKELGITTTAQFDTVKGFGGIFNEEIKRINANVNELYKQTGESVESIRQRLINGDFTPVEFKDGTIFYTYQNNVLKPIESDPLLIGIDEGKYQEGFARVKAAYDDLKNYIDSNHIKATIDVTKEGDIETTTHVTKTDANGNVVYDGNYNWAHTNRDTKYVDNTAKDTETATQNGTEAAAPEIGGSVADALSQPVDLVTKLMEERNIQSREDAQKMFDSSEKLRERLSRDYGTNQPKPPATSTGSTPAAASSAGLTVANADRFDQNPAQFFKDYMDTVLKNFGSVQEYEKYIGRWKQTLRDKATEAYNQNNSGGKWNQDAWVNEAMKAFDQTGTEAKTTLPTLESLASKIQSLGLNTKQTAGVLFEYNAAMDDGVAKNGEALGYLAKWNHETGKATKYTEENVNQTTDLMNALGSLNNAQSLYKDAMSDGKVTSEEASGIQQALAESTRLMGDAGIDANTNLSGLPGALQALASAAQAAMSQIQAAVSNANTVVQNAQTTAANIFKFGQPYKVGEMPASQLNGPQYSPYTGPTVFNPSSASVIAAQNISRYGVCRNGDWLRQYASGGPVPETGPAYLHQGEYVLRRDEVNKLTSGSPNVNLNINMSNSRFGNSELQKDLPKRIARETRRALARSGI